MKFIPKFQNGTKKAARLEKRAARLTDRANEIKTNNMAPPSEVPVAKSFTVTSTPATTPQTGVNPDPAQAAIQPGLPPVVETPKVETPKVETFPGGTVPTHVTATAELPKPAAEDLSKIDFNTKYATFNEAFGAAHKAGLKQFIGKGKPIAVRFASVPSKKAESTSTVKTTASEFTPTKLNSSIIPVEAILSQTPLAPKTSLVAPFVSTGVNALNSSIIPSEALLSQTPTAQKTNQGKTIKPAVVRKALYPKSAIELLGEAFTPNPKSAREYINDAYNPIAKAISKAKNDPNDRFFFHPKQ